MTLLLERPALADELFVPVLDDVTRRRFVSGAALTALLVACGSSNDDGSPAAAAALQKELGLTLSPRVTALPEAFPGRAELSLEQISLLEADVIMLNHITPDDREMIESNELFQRLEAVRRGSYIATEPQLGISMGYPSLLSIPYALERIVPLLAKALAA